MANTIRIKRRAAGGSTGAPASLQNAELAYNESDAGNGILYYGYGTGGAGGSATSVVPIGGDGAFVSLTGTQTISGNKTFTGTLDFSGATISGNTTFGNNLTVTGNLVVNGTTTTVDSVTMTVADKNLELGKVASPDDTTADGGGITLKGTIDKTFNWVNSTGSWTSSEHIDLASTKEYKIAGTKVLDATSLGSAVVSSSLTSVGTIGTGTWQGNTIGTGYGGTGIAGGFANGELLIGKTDGTLAKATLTAGTGITITNGNGAITIDAQETLSAGDGIDFNTGVVSVDLKTNGGLVIESTELAVDLGASSITGTLGVADGGTGQTSYTDGQLLIGKSDGTLAKATLTAGSNVTITNADGSVTIAATDTNTTYTAGDGLDLAGTEFSLDIRSGRGLQITSTELDLDDDLATLAGMQTGAATALAALTSTEIAIIDGGTSATATTLASTDRMVINDAGTMVQVALSDLVTFLEDGAVSSFDIDGGTF